MIELVLVPVRNKPGRYAALLDDEFLSPPTRQPFFEAARVLLKRGGKPETELVARHQGSSIIAMRSTIGEAAKWTITERDRGGLRKELWRARPSFAEASETAEDGTGGISGA